MGMCDATQQKTSGGKRGIKATTDLALIDREGNEYGPFDMVVLADGTKSHLRQTIEWKKGFQEDPYEWGALWTIFDDQNDVMCHSQLFQVYDKCHTMFGFLPTGIDPHLTSPFAFRDLSSSSLPSHATLSGGSKEKIEKSKTVSMFWSIKHQDVEKWRNSDFSEWIKHLSSLNPRAIPLLSQLSGPQDLAVAQYSDIEMKHMASDNIISVGDCAHATSPQLGMGVILFFHRHINHQPSIINHQPSTINHQSSTINHQSS